MLVRVHIVGVNPSAWKIRAGYLQQQMIPLSLPSTLSGDFSGVVEAIGSGVLLQGLRSNYGFAASFKATGSFAELAASRVLPIGRREHLQPPRGKLVLKIILSHNHWE